MLKYLKKGSKIILKNVMQMLTFLFVDIAKILKNNDLNWCLFKMWN